MSGLSQGAIVVSGGKGDVLIGRALRRRRKLEALSDEMVDHLVAVVRNVENRLECRVVAARTVIEENRWIQDRATEGLPKFAKQVFGSARAMLVWLEEIRPLLEEHAAEEEDGR